MSQPTTSIYLSASDPAAPSGKQDIVFQSDGGEPQQKVSAYDPVMVGDTGSGGLAGNVPAAPAGAAAAGKFLKADGTFETVTSEIVSIVGVTVDGGGSTPTTGVKGFVQVPFAGTITGWALVADEAGSASIDVWKIASSAPPSAPAVPTSANKISASAPPSLSSAQSASGGSSGISTWTTAVAAWDVIGFNLTAASTVKRITLQIFILRS